VRPATNGDQPGARVPDTRKAVLFGVPIDNLTLEETLDRIEEMIRSDPTHQHVVVNVDKIVKLQSRPSFDRQSAIAALSMPTDSPLSGPRDSWVSR
jgi:UDP-N-acetyl-D-mannosaminuronic acid transferase (WecB/TagA/CpsF family)